MDVANLQRVVHPEDRRREVAMRQGSTHHIQPKTYPLDPLSRAYYGYYPGRQEDEAGYKDAGHQDRDEAREWQNPSRFGHRSVW
jgi:hypothetical protein